MAAVLFMLIMVVFVVYLRFDWPSLIMESKPDCADDQHASNADHHHPTAEQQRTAEQHNWRSQNFISVIATVISGFVALFTFIVALLALGTYCETRRQADAAEKTLALAYPPKFYLIHFEIPDEPTDFPAGAKVNGSAQIFLSGRDKAKIKKFVCISYWGKEEYLPMHRPYIPPEGQPFHECALRQNGIAYQNGTWFEPGSFLEWSFDTEPSPVEDTNRTLYVMGFLEFADARTEDRFSLYARRYNPGKRRFEKVGNTDYEREDESALDGKSP